MIQTIKHETVNEYTTLLRLVDVYNQMINPEGKTNMPWLRCRMVRGVVSLWDNSTLDYIICDRVSVAVAIEAVAHLMTQLCNFPEFLYSE